MAAACHQGLAFCQHRKFPSSQFPTPQRAAAWDYAHQPGTRTSQPTDSTPGHSEGLMSFAAHCHAAPHQTPIAVSRPEGTTG
jgi:hypothetical protein